MLPFKINCKVNKFRGVNWNLKFILVYTNYPSEDKNNINNKNNNNYKNKNKKQGLS